MDVGTFSNAKRGEVRKDVSLLSALIQAMENRVSQLSSTEAIHVAPGYKIAHAGLFGAFACRLGGASYGRVHNALPSCNDERRTAYRSRFFVSPC